MPGRKPDDPITEDAENLLGLGGDTDDALEAAMKGEDPAVEERLHPILSNEEVLSAREEAARKVLEQRKAAAKKAIVAEEMNRLAVEEGITTGDGVKDEMVTVTLDLAEHSSCITINMVPYWHGHTYTVPRHVADTLREIQSRGHDHQTDLDGKGLAEKMRKPRNTIVSGKTNSVSNAPQRVA